MRWFSGGAAALLLCGVLALGACDKGGSAPARDHSGDGARDAGPASDGGSYSGERRSSARSSDYGDEPKSREAIPMLDGKPMWADNRKHTAEENVDYQFGKWGADLGAKSAKDYALKARRFIDHPPSDVQTVLRSNGDKLMYDPGGNIFLVARRDGAPRTMFKPRDGADYWKEQQAKAASGDTGYGGRGKSRYHAPNAKEFGSGDT